MTRPESISEATRRLAEQEERINELEAQRALLQEGLQQIQNVPLNPAGALAAQRKANQIMKAFSRQWPEQMNDQP